LCSAAGAAGGIGRLTGTLYGLLEAGADLSDTDVIIGMSAGSSVGAQLAPGKLTLLELYQRELGPQSRARAGGGTRSRG